jgi:hypothetical protein
MEGQMKTLLLSLTMVSLLAGTVSPAFAQGGDTWVNREYYKQVTPYCGPYDKATRCFRSLSGQPPAAR